MRRGATNMTMGTTNIVVGIVGACYAVGFGLGALAFLVESIRVRGLWHRLLLVVALLFSVLCRTFIMGIQPSFDRANDPVLQSMPLTVGDVLSLIPSVALALLALIAAMRSLRWAFRPLVLPHVVDSVPHAADSQPR